jgi:hypothetical protein
MRDANSGGTISGGTMRGAISREAGGVISGGTMARGDLQGGWRQRELYVGRRRQSSSMEAGGARRASREPAGPPAPALDRDDQID